MQAFAYQGLKKVRVETVPAPVLMAADDMIQCVTATAVCGSDLYINHGKIRAMKDGDILGQ